jgi:hypothetical protein
VGIPPHRAINAAEIPGASVVPVVAPHCALDIAEKQFANKIEIISVGHQTCKIPRNDLSFNAEIVLFFWTHLFARHSK